eukprot:TRINITY_DN38165_c0_g1_i1.p1 TRINITY_DN38165_c0_g1~~TRINITY_DN38165_c0_g1_i1.p1  ORF type:complete len:488 (+),score=150.85 TRINITY_DN38165_c0_g1_i1:89-1465(+)
MPLPPQQPQRPAPSPPSPSPQAGSPSPRPAPQRGPPGRTARALLEARYVRKSGGRCGGCGAELQVGAFAFRAPDAAPPRRPRLLCCGCASAPQPAPEARSPARSSPRALSSRSDSGAEVGPLSALRAAAAELAEAVDGEHSAAAAAARGRLAEALQQEGEDARAEAELRKALAVLLQVHGGESPDSGTCRSQLGWSLLLQGRVEQGRRELVRALAALQGRRRHGAVCRARLGWALLSAGDPAAAAEHLQRALRELLLLAEHRGDCLGDAATCRSMLGWALLLLGRLQEAAAELAAALPLLVQEQGEGSVGVGVCLSRLGMVLCSAGASLPATRCLRAACGALSAALGRAHPAAAACRENLAAAEDALALPGAAEASAAACEALALPPLPLPSERAELAGVLELVGAAEWEDELAAAGISSVAALAGVYGSQALVLRCLPPHVRHRAASYAARIRAATD